MRRRLLGKQITLAWAAGCTDAAVSQWEHGKRAPNGEKLERIAIALGEAGASTDDLDDLREAWERVKLRFLR
jgi:transcriptional regulator with XRE-family HTH domain